MKPHAKLARLMVQVAVVAILIFPLHTAQAQFLWSERIASVSFWPEEPNIGLALDASDNCYVTGWFDGTNDFGGVTLTNQSAGGSDIFVAKYNASGALQWVQRAGGTSSNYGRGVGTDTNGNVYVAGTYQGPASFNGVNLPATSGEEFFLAKYNNAGAVQWVQSSAGGSDQNIGIGLTVDGAGNSYALAVMDHSATSLSFGTKTVTTANYGHTLLILVKYDNTGTVQWAQLFDSSQETYGSKVAVDAAGNVYVRATFDSDMEIGTSNFVGSAGTKNMFVAKLNSAGTLIWVQQPQGSGGEGGVAVDPAGNVYVSGYFTNTLNFGGGIGLTNVANASAPFGDAFIAKYSSGGAIQWAQPAGGTNGGFYWDLALDAQTNIYAAGFLGLDAAVTKYSPAGSLEWSYSASGLLASPVSSGVAKCAVDSVGNCYLAGFYEGTTIFGADMLEPQETWNVFLAEVGPYSFGAEIQSTSLANITYDSTSGIFQYTDSANPSEDYAGLPLAGNIAASITNTSDWTASLTVNLPARTMTATSSEEPFVGMGLFVLVNGSVNNIIELALEQRNDTGVPNYNLYGNGVPFTALVNGQGVQTTPLGGSQLQHNGTSLLQLSSGTATGPATETNEAASGVLTLSFSATNDTLTGNYNGTPVGSICLTNWGANPSLTLAVAGLSDGGVAVPAGTDIANNFSSSVTLPQNPIIQFTANPTNGVAPLTVQFNAPSVDSLTNTITSWKWSFGDGGTSTNQNPSYTYTNAGTFNPTFVATNNQGTTVIGSGPQITAIDPLDRWTLRSPIPTGSDLHGIAFGDGEFVAVGGYTDTWGSEHAVVLTSADGANWNTQSSDGGATLNGIAYGNGLFVAVGDFGTILTSTDGTSWTNRNSGTRDVLYAVTYGDGQFVVAGNHGFG